MPDLERSALAECEAVIERGLQTFYEVGTALLKIRNDGLYRPDYGTFEEYCKKRWRWTRGYANAQIRAAEIVQNLDTMVSTPENERQVRPLVGLEPEQQREAWRIATEQTAPRAPFGREVEDVVRTHFENRPTLAEVQAERRAREAEARAEQLLRERRAAERRAEEALKERDDAEVRRYMRFRKLIEAVQYIAEFHVDSVGDAWDGITNARGGAEFMENVDKAQRCLTRLKIEHPNAVRKPGIVLQKLS
jgi:hypothetical protein